MMKMILICTLMTLIVINVKGQDSSQYVYYQKTIFQKGRFEIYGWTSYDLYWADESGIGINLNLNKKRKYGRKIHSGISNWNYPYIWNPLHSQQNKRVESKERIEISPKGYPFSKILQRDDK